MKTTPKSWLPALACLLVAGACGAPTKGSGRVVTKTVPVESFSRIEANHGFDVSLSPGTHQNVTLRLDDNFVDDLDLAVSEGTLRLRLTSRRSASHDATLHADVVVPSITSVNADGGAKVQLADGLSAEALHVALSGGSFIDGAVDTERFDLGMSGGSRAELRGRASGLEVVASGGAALDAMDLHVEDADIQLSGGARATTSASDTISAVVSGASSLRYAGTAHFVRRDVSGASTIREG